MKTKVKKGLALVIANADYVYQRKLPSCKKDGNDMQRVLEGLEFDVLTAFDTNRGQMLTALGEFLKIADLYSTVLLYYTGHGVQIDGENYFVPIDCGYNDTKAIFVSTYLVGMNVVSEYYSEHPEKTNIMILDACRDNPGFAKGMISTGLAEIDAGSGTLIAFATAPNKSAFCPNTSTENGYYTQSLLDHIGQPNLKIEDMFKAVRKDVVAMTGGNQTPWESTSLNSDFFFNTMSEAEIDENIYQMMRNHYSAEVLITMSQLFRKDISELMRIYEHQKSEKPGGIYFSNSESFEQLILERILGMGFEYNNYRWVYKEIPVRMGEFFHDYKSEIVPQE